MLAAVSLLIALATLVAFALLLLKLTLLVLLLILVPMLVLTTVADVMLATTTVEELFKAAVTVGAMLEMGAPSTAVLWLTLTTLTAEVELLPSSVFVALLAVVEAGRTTPAVVVAVLILEKFRVN